jgi:uncharacterized membrane protein YeaQ/YmgE (transglycosylase-associated protein family)
MDRINRSDLIVLGLALVGLVVLAGPLLQIAGGLFALALTLLTWMFAGALAGRILRGEGYGPLGDIGLGLAGGIVGTMLFSLLGLGWFAGIPFVGPILVGAVGAVVFVYVMRLFNRNFAK